LLAATLSRMKLLKSSLLLSSMTFISRIFGFLRDIVAAMVFGAGPGYDAFILAFRIPNLLRRMFAEGAFSQAFIPVLAENKISATPEEQQAFISNIAGNLALALLIITILGMLCAPLIIRLFAPGFELNDPRESLSISMLMVTFPYIFFISLTALAGSVLNVNNNFIAPAITPVILNLAMIAGSLYLAPKLATPEMALAWGVLVAGILQLLFQIPFLKKYGIAIRLSLNWHDPKVKKVLKLMLPATFGAAILQINLLIDSFFASFLQTGSISWLYYADRLMEFPLGVISVSLCTVLLPALAKSFAKNDFNAFAHKLDWALAVTLAIGVPAVIGLWVLAEPLIVTLFKSDKFITHDIIMTKNALQAYSFAIIGIMVAKIFSNAFYAIQDIKTPVKVNMVILVVNIVFNFLFIQKYQHVGLAAATSVTSMINALILIILWKRKHKFAVESNTWKLSLQILFASGLMILFLYYFNPTSQAWLDFTKLQAYLALLLLILGGMLVYAATLLIVGVKPKKIFLM
jgi:putative peptidoglycan lipid II flippase